jgi:hypothetical protein
LYSQRIVERSQARVEQAAQLKLVRYDREYVFDRVEQLQSLLNDKGLLSRELVPDEQRFIKNERLLCAIDYRYWSDRYANLIQEQGGLGVAARWESQEILLRAIAAREDEITDAFDRGEPVDGILIALPKARQLGATAEGRKLCMHRMTSGKYVRLMAASVDDDKILELYDRDKLILDNLPFYLKPSFGFDEKAQHIFLDKLGSRILYQTSNQKFGVGQGRQFDVSHLTECASWEYPDRIEHDFLPTIPQSPRSFSLWESSAQGRGNWWHRLIEKIQKKWSRRLIMVFIPWYAERTKYRAQPPSGWTPNEETMAHARRIYDTSGRYVGKPDLVLSREQLYWWESTREEYYRSNNLNLFYTNYCATVEESFQHSTKSAFSFECLEFYRNRAAEGRPYRIAQEALL